MLSGMKAKASLAGGICSTGRLYFFFLGYFCGFVLPLTNRQRACGMDLFLWFGRGETPAPGSLWMPGLVLQGRRESLPGNLFDCSQSGHIWEVNLLGKLLVFSWCPRQIDAYE